MSKEQMIKSIATAGVSRECIERLKTLSAEDVREEFKEFALSMKD